MRHPFDKILNWYFTKNSLPYWCILLIDCLTVGASGLLSYWIFNAVEYAGVLHYPECAGVQAVPHLFGVHALFEFRGPDARGVW